MILLTNDIFFFLHFLFILLHCLSLEVWWYNCITHNWISLSFLTFLYTVPTTLLCGNKNKPSFFSNYWLVLYFFIMSAAQKSLKLLCISVMPIYINMRQLLNMYSSSLFWLDLYLTQQGKNTEHFIPRTHPKRCCWPRTLSHGNHVLRWFWPLYQDSEHSKNASKMVWGVQKCVWVNLLQNSPILIQLSICGMC